MKTAILLLASLGLCLVARAESPDSIPDSLKTNRSFIYDGAKVLNDADKHRIDDTISVLEKKTGAQLRVVTVQTLDGMSVEDWSNAVFRRIGIGHKGKNDGAFFVFAIQDRKSRIEVGYGLEDRLTDARVGTILRDQIRPAFRAGNYGQGIFESVNVAANYVEGGKRPVLPSSSGNSSSGSTVPPPSSRPSSSSGGNSFPSGNSSGTTYSSRPASGGGSGSGGVLLLLGVLAVGGVGAIAYASTRPRRCPRCNTAMTSAEAPANELNDVQQCEQRLGSRSFSKFSCPKCAYSEIDPKDVTFSGYTTCQNCGNRTARTERRTISTPSYDFEGEEQITETCEYPPCHYNHRYTRTLSRLVRSTSSASTGGFIGGFSGGSNDSSSSSSSGGSYDGGSSSSSGGGDSGSGGASSSW